MLLYLTVRNLAVIEHVSIEFGPGLTALTGETGAGKSILVEAVGLLLGGRASADLVRTGADAALIEAQFEEGGEEILVRREITAQGRSRAFINGTMATAGALRELSDRLIELHGQHEHQVLLDAESHLDLLDGLAGLDAPRQRVAEAFARLQTLREEARGLQLNEREKAARIDLLTFQRSEITAASPRPGEDDELAARRQVLANAERLQRLSAEAYAALYDSDDAALASLTTVWKRVGELAALDARLQPYLDNRDAIKGQLEDLAFFLRHYTEDVDASPNVLAEVEDRIALLDRLKRKYGPTLSDVLAHAQSCEEQLSALQHADERLRTISADLDAASADYQALAHSLSAARRQAAGEFAPRLRAALADLALPHARIAFEFATVPDGEGQWSARGIDRAELLLSANPGEDPRPLARIASGGELSRVMLAIRGLTRGAAAAGTLVFDEVDAGIGGRTADAVGRALQRLGSRAQVLCITHLPQIAACGRQHVRVSKVVRSGRTHAIVEPLTGDERVAELARMMAGGATGAAIFASAADLLRSNRGESEGQSKGESESPRQERGESRGQRQAKGSK